MVNWSSFLATSRTKCSSREPTTTSSVIEGKHRVSIASFKVPDFGGLNSVPFVFTAPSTGDRKRHFPGKYPNWRILCAMRYAPNELPITSASGVQAWVFKSCWMTSTCCWKDREANGFDWSRGPGPPVSLPIRSKPLAEISRPRPEFSRPPLPGQ